MAHLHTEPGQYDLTVSMYVISTQPEPRLLLHQHKVLHKLMQPGGHVELTETPWQCVAHELVEETGFDLDQLQILQPMIRPPALPGDVLHPQPICLRSFPYGSGSTHFHTDLAFGFIADQEPRHPVGPGESDQFVWASRADLISLSPNATYEDARTLGVFIIDEILPAWQAIPTAHFSLDTPA
ncbi:MAG: NUDIX domain-containing protein [Propionibacteriaceae bacterium]|jgi:8-oxo-dGTP pyrophosphatase MutT (NUDIX family)|nr:NUDIX domain-containing protein [Propionibacteriaceae bacterium]